eukprot:TRINITY_DN7228_c0_g1_i2.p1 TRINITY_DN7228_c0_g1~~TRINITY_DN7228_c0_g1_i2.p1  ORF type:complete len:317 (-),score=109.39 TRINITY_DN7228_c0_g1_i2:1143-2093(-)
MPRPNTKKDENQTIRKRNLKDEIANARTSRESIERIFFPSNSSIPSNKTSGSLIGYREDGILIVAALSAESKSENVIRLVKYGESLVEKEGSEPVILGEWEATESRDNGRTIELDFPLDSVKNLTTSIRFDRRKGSVSLLESSLPSLQLILYDIPRGGQFYSDETLVFKGNSLEQAEEETQIASGGTNNIFVGAMPKRTYKWSKEEMDSPSHLFESFRKINSSDKIECTLKGREKDENTENLLFFDGFFLSLFNLVFRIFYSGLWSTAKRERFKGSAVLNQLRWRMKKMKEVKADSQLLHRKRGEDDLQTRAEYVT